MEFWVTVNAADGTCEDVAVKAAAAATAEEVARGLAHHLQLPAPGGGESWRLYCHRRQAWIPCDRPAEAMGVRHGDRLALAVAPREFASDRDFPAGGEVLSAEETFNRPPRVIHPPSGGVHRLGAPPSDPRAPRVPVAAALLPLVLGGVTLLFFRSPLTLVFLAMSPLLAVGSYFESRLGGRAEFRRARQEFLEQLDALRAELAVATTAEWRARNEAAPGLRELAVAAHRRGSGLWARRPRDPDFLELRIGVADLPSRHTVEIAGGGSAALRAAAEGALGVFATLARGPLTVKLPDAGVLGIVGPAEPVREAARWLVVQAACLHSPAHLSVCAALPPGEAERWQWLSWLPHTRASALPFEGAGIRVDEAGARDMLYRLSEALDARLSGSRQPGGTSGGSGRADVLLLLHEDLALPREPLTRVLEEGPQAGIQVLWLGSRMRDLPSSCGAVLECGPGRQAALTFPGEGTSISADATADRVSVAEARQVAMELAPLRDAAGAGSQGQLPRRAGLLEVLGLPARPTVAVIASRWATSEGLSATIGSTGSGPFTIDLRAHGPHALVGGTTGAGKSELLRALVGAMAADHPPARLNFLLVDYKGGAAFRDAATLPHTAGVVTDLDPHLAARALVSLGAERRRRERILASAGVRDLSELERLDPSGCPPSLVIVVDELAALAREVPAFIDGLVDLAQRGRSLGLHLVLATQRPAGVVTDSIRANTNLRVALRVADEMESIDVVGVPDAARIPRGLPGRAFARSGHEELQQFQVARASATLEPASGPAVQVNALGASGPSWAAGTVDQGAAGDTDLQRLAAATRSAHDAADGMAAPRPWLPPLPDVLPWTPGALGAQFEPPAAIRDGLRPAPCSLAVGLGLIDLPDEQRQAPWVFDLANEGSLLVLGTAGSGRTSLLRLFAAALAADTTAERLHIYCVDGGGGGLGAVGALPHCGAVIAGDETERLVRLSRFLRATIDRRRATPTAGGDAIREPAIIVLVDNYPGLAAALERVEFGVHADGFPRLVADGPVAGVHFVITADRRGAVPPALAAAVDRRLVLRMAEADEYRNAGLDATALKDIRMPPGRGFLATGREVQLAVLGETGTAGEQAEVIRQLGARVWSASAAPAPARIELLPAVVVQASMPAPSSPLRAVVGLADADLRPVEVDLGDSSWLVTGPRASGRSSALAVLALGLRGGSPGCRIVLIAPRPSAPAGVDAWDVVAEGPRACADRLSILAAEVAATGPRSRTPLFIFIDDAEELAEGADAAVLAQLVRTARDGAVRIVAAVEVRAAHRAYSGWIADIRKGRDGLLLQPDPDLDGDLLGARLPRVTRSLPPGRGFLVRRGEPALVQVAALPTATRAGD